MNPDPHRGEVWYANLDPTRGREQAGERPVLILSVDTFNHGPADLVVAIPITTTARGILSHTRMDPPNGGLKRTSFVMCEAVRCISKERLRRLCGTVDSRIMLEVEYAVRTILGL
ncbi:MAG: type II toxin-antitoxin system PemK/MazF family toxin [Gemmatimonadetes bacterium]|nr:type II toxin-antitoxin system PemK/MazF family toxin [Gemmatimonadota bacterium]